MAWIRSKKSQQKGGFFKDSDLKEWGKHWKNMPEFVQEDTKPIDYVMVYFRRIEDKKEFLTLLNYDPDRRRSIWYPKMQHVTQEDMRKDAKPNATAIAQNKYPVYIVSKGRWETRITSRELEALNIPYHIVIEPQEYENYASFIDPDKILVLPFSNLGQGSIPARNWIWKHSMEQGAERHWILDDNIRGFYKLNQNLKIKLTNENPFVMAEEFVDRYENIALAGFQYEFFVPRRDERPPFILNTRIYSCILIKNDIPYEWRGRYNEDTDLSLRALKDGWCTVLFNAILAKKVSTMLMKGGNTDELYQGDGRLEMARSLRDQHPDVVTISRKWGRWQHHVDYRRFRRNRLILKKDAEDGSQEKTEASRFLRKRRDSC